MTNKAKTNNLNYLIDPTFNKNNCIKFETESIKSSLFNSSDAFILVT